MWDLASCFLRPLLHACSTILFQEKLACLESSPTRISTSHPWITLISWQTSFHGRTMTLSATTAHCEWQCCMHASCAAQVLTSSLFFFFFFCIKEVLLLPVSLCSQSLCQEAYSPARLPASDADGGNGKEGGGVKGSCSPHS